MLREGGEAEDGEGEGGHLGGTEEGTEKKAAIWQLLVRLTVPPRPLFFQTLDINWTGMTNLLDIPGLRYQGLPEHLPGVAAWPGGFQSSERLSGALREPGAKLGRSGRYP